MSEKLKIQTRRTGGEWSDVPFMAHFEDEFNQRSILIKNEDGTWRGKNSDEELPQGFGENWTFAISRTAREGAEQWIADIDMPEDDIEYRVVDASEPSAIPVENQ